MKLFKYLLLAVVVCFVIIVSLGIYRFNFTNDDIYVVTEDGSVVAHGSAQHQITNLFPFDESTRDNFLVSLPESDVDIQVALTSFSRNGKLELASGQYSDGEARGNVMLDYQRIVPLNFPDENQMTTFAAPFAVTTQGSGVFWYVGLFCQDQHSGRIRHLASEFIGDRIKVDEIRAVAPFVNPYKIQLTYRDRSDDLPMNQEPNIKFKRQFNVSTSKLLPTTPLY